MISRVSMKWMRVSLIACVGSVSLAGCAGTGAEASGESSTTTAVEPNSYRELESVKAFEHLQTTLNQMKEMVLEDSETEREAYEGMRALLRILAMSSDVTGDGNAKAPHFARMDTKIRKVGGDNPDAEYDNISLTNEWDYVIRGNVGTVRHLSFTISGSRGADGRSGKLGYFNERTLAPKANGDFEIHLTKQDDGGPNWVDTSPGINSILVRQYIGDRETETLANYEIEVVGREAYEEIPYSTDREVAARLAETAYSLQFMSTMHRTIMPELFDSPNTFARLNSNDFGADISGSDNLYMIGTYQIATDEALIIETNPLDVRYWSLAIESRWHESVDYATRRTHRSIDHSVVDADGKLRFVLAHGKTPHPNWLDTGGHGEGFMTFRWVGERETLAELPTVLRVKRSEVEAALAKRQIVD
jgi:hypothetical protein